MKNSRPSGKNFSAGLSKLNSTCPKEHLEENIFLKKLFFIIFGLRQFFKLFAESFRQGGQNCILPVQRNNLMNIFLER